MTDDERRALLEAVSRGELSPVEAAARLAETWRDDPSGATAPAAPDEPSRPTEPAEPSAGAEGGDDPIHARPEPALDALLGPVAPSRGATPPPAAHRPPAGARRRIRIEVGAGSARVVGDPTVAEVEVEGGHEVVMGDGEVVVRVGGLGTLSGLGLFGGDDEGPGDPRRPHLHHTRIRDVRGMGAFVFEQGRRGRLGNLRLSGTVVRVNPQAPVELVVSAGSAQASHLEGPLRVRVDAGSAVLRHLSGPVDGAVHAGSLRIGNWRLTTGESRIECDLGSASVELSPESDVTVTVDSTLGAMGVRFPGVDAATTNHERPMVLGAGRASLHVTATLGSCAVRVDEAVGS